MASRRAFGTPGITMTSPVWFWWTQIARDQLKHARAAATSDAPLNTEKLLDETFPSMIVVSASAHALDGFYGTIKPIVQPPPSAASRHRQILEALKLGFHVGAKMHVWVGEFDWLFDLRDAALHHEEVFNSPVAHPSLPTNVAPENADYSLRSAERAWTLLKDVLTTCLEAPKPPITEWVARKRPSTLATLAG